MAFELEWRVTENSLGLWRDFDHADDLKSFVAKASTCRRALHGELRVRLRSSGKEMWGVVTTAAAIHRWQPPKAPEPLLAARWTVEDAAAASQLRHVGRLRSCLGAARDDGLLEPAQVEEFVAIFDQAVAGEGPAGRHVEPLDERLHDIGRPPASPAQD